MVPLDVCNIIKESRPFMGRIKNVTVLSGSMALIDCKVLNYGQIENERVNIDKTQILISSPICSIYKKSFPIYSDLLHRARISMKVPLNS